jgi:hypothetical protein
LFGGLERHYRLCWSLRGKYRSGVCCGSIVE